MPQKRRYPLNQSFWGKMLVACVSGGISNDRRQLCELITETVVEVPSLLCAEECAILVDAARRRAKEIGWRAAQHGRYTTEDIKMGSLGDARAISIFEQRAVSPLITQIAEAFQLSATSLEVSDAFLVRYDPNGQASLPRHRDGSIVSATVSLSNSDDYVGGGTCIDGITFCPEQGGAVLFAGARVHSGQLVTKGTRYILTIFFKSGDKSCHFCTKDQDPLFEGSPIDLSSLLGALLLVEVVVVAWKFYCAVCSPDVYSG